MLLIQLGSPSRCESVACGWSDSRSGNRVLAPPSLGQGRSREPTSTLAHQSRGAERPPGVGFGQGAETGEGRSLWVGVGRVQAEKGRVRGRGLRSAGAGRRGQSWIPEATDASILAGVGVAAQAGRRWDAAGPGVRRRGLGLSAVGVAPGGVPCVSGLQGAGHFGPREGGWQPACKPQPQALLGARAEEPGARHPEETRLSGGLELGRARTVHLKQR